MNQGEGFQVIIWVDDAFTNNPMAVVRYDYKYLASGKAKMDCLFNKFDIMESHMVIDRWKKGDDSINEYLRKLQNFDGFVGILWWCVIFIYCIEDQMANIYL